MSISLIQITRKAPSGTDTTVTTTPSPGPIENIRASFAAVFLLPIGLAVLAFGTNYLLECVKLSNAKELARYNIELARPAPAVSR